MKLSNGFCTFSTYCTELGKGTDMHARSKF